MPERSWNAEIAAQAAEPTGFGPLEFHPTHPSTNDRLGELADSGAPAGQLVVAGEQTAGRGRAGRSFNSPSGGLYVSVLLRPAAEVLRRYPLSLVVGLALCQALEELGAPAGLKWPNDVWISGRKVAGILIEVAYQGSQPRVVIGVGVNVETSAAELPPEALSLGETPRAPSRAEVCERFLLRLHACLRQLERGDVDALRADVEAHSVLIGQRVRALANGQPVLGRVVGLAESGALRLQPDDGPELELLSGDVERVRPQRGGSEPAR